jgi:Contractile injection system tape measure protein
MQSPMTRPNRHRIRRQLVELAIGAAAQGPAAQQELARPFWDRAIPELEQVFDRAAGPDELLRLDRLELDLGAIGGADWPAEFRRKLIVELTRSLAQFTAVSEIDEGERGDPRPAEAWRQFLFFLAHGRLPWWAAALRRRWNEILSKGSDADWSALRKTISSDPRARSRLVYSVDDAFLERVIARWSGAPDAARVLEHLMPTPAGGDARQRWRRGFWMLLLDWVVTGGFRLPSGGPQLVRDLMTLRQMYDPEIGPAAFRRSRVDDGAAAHGIGAAGEGGLPEPWRAWWLLQGDAAPSERATPESHAEAGTLNGRSPVVVPPRAAAPERKPRAVEEEAIYLGGAGVILVHPFLEQLFRERELLEDRDFRDPEARDRAVHLIGFITFGRVDVPEHELVLAKALCGAALEDPIEPVRLDDGDLDACDAVLRAVLQHWTALRSSSPEWLRQQFFLREGKLERADQGWILTIELHAQDVLLARLPWGFGVVALPWLSDRIFVHWLD